ncbi:hypothetical protein [Dinoroseobacter sp. S76]|uniref:hypothetical protein n=1 Tax=Dinoroseobacter sp. S76 TaxID=3415124 RepID=UPI003C7AADA3
MKVSITQETRKAGLLGGKREWTTTMTLTLSEEEKAIIAEGGIGSRIALAVPQRGDVEDFNYSIEQITTRPVSADAFNKLSANDHARNFKSAAANLKATLEDVTTDETGEFEL